MRVLILVAALCSSSCNFAQKHPAVTVGITTGVIAFGMCGINVEKIGTCSLIGAIGGLALGGITGLVTLIGNTNAPPDEAANDLNTPIETGTEAPPGLPDGGLPFAAPVDAGVPPIDAPADAS